MAMTIEEIDRNVAERGYLTDEEEYQVLLLENESPNPSQAIFPDEATIESYRGRLPDVLLRLWKEKGWGAWSEGRYWICDPTFLQPVLEAVFKGDPEFHAKDMIGYGYTAFGQIDIYLGDFKYIRLNMGTSYVSARSDYLELRAGEVPMTENYAMTSNLQNRVYVGTPEVNEVLEVGTTDMFPLAVEKFGLLEPGEIYGFAPPFPVTRTQEFKNLHKMKLREYLIFLNELERPTLYTYQRPKDTFGGSLGTITPGRKIGPQ